MRGWPVHRPTHAPATTLKTNGNSAPHKTKKTKSALILVGKNYHRHSAEWTLQRKEKSGIPRKATLESMRSCRFAGPAPASARPRMKTTSSQNHRAVQSRQKCIRHSGIFISRRKENIRNLRRKAGMTSHWRECEAPLRRTQRDGADETILCRSGCGKNPPAWGPNGCEAGEAPTFSRRNSRFMPRNNRNTYASAPASAPNALPPPSKRRHLPQTNMLHSQALPPRPTHRAPPIFMPPIVRLPHRAPQTRAQTRMARLRTLRSGNPPPTPAPLPRPASPRTSAIPPRTMTE